MSKEQNKKRPIKIPNDDYILNLKENKEIVDLSDNKKSDTENNVYRIIELGNGIRMRIIMSEQGTYVDIRKFHIDHYTHRGVKVPITKFIKGSEIVKGDYDTMDKYN